MAPGWAAFVLAAVVVFWPATVVAAAVVCDELAGWPDVEEPSVTAAAPAVAPVAAAGADPAPPAVAALVAGEDGLVEPPSVGADVAGAPALSVDSVAAVVVTVGLG